MPKEDGDEIPSAQPVIGPLISSNLGLQLKVTFAVLQMLMNSNINLFYMYVCMYLCIYVLKKQAYLARLLIWYIVLKHKLMHSSKHTPVSYFVYIIIHPSYLKPMADIHIRTTPEAKFMPIQLQPAPRGPRNEQAIAIAKIHCHYLIPKIYFV